MNSNKTITLLDVTQDNKRSYGKLKFNTKTEDIYFQNIEGKVTSLVKKNKIPKSYQDTSVLSNHNYIVDKWITGNSYSDGSLVYDDNYRMYVSIKKINTSVLPPYIDVDNWKVLTKNSTESKYIQYVEKDEKEGKPVIFALFTNGSCCFTYNEDDACSSFNKDNCIYNHDKPSTIYNFSKIVFEKPLISLPFLFISKNDNRFYHFNNDNKSITILNKGFYRIAYNLAYCGSMRYLICYMSAMNDERMEKISYSVSKSINYSIDDGSFKEWLSNDSVLNDAMQTLNHTFYVPIKYDNTRILFNIEVSSKNINSEIYIHPINTWLSIEKKI